ncbi:MAG: hypothetical protein Q7R84_00415 [bacterium]|nr:hypothetical protein [bacterium]
MKKLIYSLRESVVWLWALRIRLPWSGVKCDGYFEGIQYGKEHKPVEMIKVCKEQYECPLCSLRMRRIKASYSWLAILIFFSQIFSLGIFILLFVALKNPTAGIVFGTLLIICGTLGDFLALTMVYEYEKV